MLKKQFFFGMFSGVLLCLVIAGSYIAYTYSRINARLTRTQINVNDPILIKRRNDISSSIFLLRKLTIQSLPQAERDSGSASFDGLEKVKNVLTRNDVDDLEKGYLLSEEMRLGDSKIDNEKSSKLLIYTIDIIIHRHAL